MIAILADYDYTHVVGIYENKEAAERALLKFILVEYSLPSEFRWVEFTFGETCFDWDESKRIFLEGDKIKFSQQIGW